MVVRRPGTDEKKKGGTGEGGQTKAPGNIYYKTLVTYLDIDRSGCNGECFERNPLVRSISLISFFFFFFPLSFPLLPFYFYFRLESLSAFLDADPFYPFLKFFLYLAKRISRIFFFFS